MPKQIILSALFLSGVLAGSAHAEHEGLNAVPYDDIVFDDASWSPELVSLGQMGPYLLPADFRTGVEPPPKNASDATRRELGELLFLQSDHRSDNVLQKIDRENDPNFVILDEMVRQGFLVPESQAPVLWAMLSLFDREVVYYTLRDKKTFRRARPTQLEPELTSTIPVPGHAAYPSGHAAQFWAAAVLMTSLNPGCASAYKGFARDVGARREVAGVHYASDSAAGRVLAQSVFDGFMALDLMDDIALDLAAEVDRNGSTGLSCPGPAPAAWHIQPTLFFSAMNGVQDAEEDGGS